MGTTRPPRIGLLGGAFDPPHRAHAALARAALEQLQLDELRVVPTGQAWHKARPLSEGQHRLAMARLAFGGLPQVVIDERELERPGPTYTVDTLRELAGERPGAALFLVIGEDQALAFDRWREPGEIARLATIAVAARPLEAIAASPPHAARQPLEGDVQWQTLSMELMPVSATDIRQRLARGLGTADLLDPQVARYIAQHHLYQAP